MVHSIKDFFIGELIEELQRRSGASVVFIRQKTNEQKKKYLMGVSGPPTEVTKLMVIGSDHILTKFDEEEDDDDPTDRRGHPDPPDGSLM